MPQHFTSYTYSLLGIIGFFLLVSASQVNQPEFNIKGSIKEEKGHPDSELVLVNATSMDSVDVNLKKGRFGLSLEFETHYLLLVKRKDRDLKKILISTFRPISSQDYQVKMVLDVRNLSDNSRFGLLEYNGFQGRFVIKPLLASELRRRRYEFSTFYAAMSERKK